MNEVPRIEFRQRAFGDIGVHKYVRKWSGRVPNIGTISNFSPDLPHQEIDGGRFVTDLRRCIRGRLIRLVVDDEERCVAFGCGVKAAKKFQYLFEPMAVLLHHS